MSKDAPRMDTCEACGREFVRGSGERSDLWPFCPDCDPGEPLPRELIRLRNVNVLIEPSGDGWKEIPYRSRY